MACSTTPSSSSKHTRRTARRSGTHLPGTSGTAGLALRPGVRRAEPPRPPASQSPLALTCANDIGITQLAAYRTAHSGHAISRVADGRAAATASHTAVPCRSMCGTIQFTELPIFNLRLLQWPVRSHHPMYAGQHGCWGACSAVDSTGALQSGQVGIPVRVYFCQCGD